MSADLSPTAYRFKAVIFDLDGTLLNTLADIGNAMNQVLMTSGYPIHPIDMYKYFIGDGLEKLIERSLPTSESTPKKVRAHLHDFRKTYAKNWHETTRPYPGIPDMLDRLKKNGFQLSILSNKAHDFTNQIVDKLLAPWAFRPVIGSSRRFPKKPDPTAALSIVRELGLDRGDCILIGDSGVDMQTAAAAGITSVGASWGFRPEAELIENGCRFLARHPRDVDALLE
jgi:phosphoglycolate phosphatase